MGVRGASLAACVGLLAIGLYASSPFLCDRLVGTGEAYNYSLSVADALGQMRGGIVPPLAGQTVFAFNGRIHPLRNAPYLYYMSAAVDAATRRTLTAWEIQNVCLTLSLIGAGIACFIGLRIGVECRTLPAFLLSALYALGPPLLGAAHSFDLFMTVHAAVFVPLAVAACFRGILRPSVRADAWLAATVAGAWLTHPPVALWLTAGVVFMRLLAFCRRPTWLVLVRGICAVLLAAALCVFVFASVAALNASTGALTVSDTGKALVPNIMANLRASFPDCILPVERDAGALGSLQFGYPGWFLLGFTACQLYHTRRSGALKRNAWLASLGAVVFAVGLLFLTLPVPYLTAWLWRSAPSVVLELTTTWPMQRLYLLALPFTLFGSALMLPAGWGGLWSKRWHGPIVVLLALVWTLYQANAYIGRGYHDRRPAGETAALYRPSNIDLTETSYAFVGVPPDYVVGVIDPLFEFRLLKNGTDEVGSNLTAAEETGTIIKKFSLNSGKPAFVTLEPGKRYLLTFAFRTAPMTGAIYVSGPLLSRGYTLPSAGQPKGFGMLGGESRSIPLWTDGKKPEIAAVRIKVPELETRSGKLVDFADVTLREIALEKLPVRLESLTPLKFSVTASQEGLTVETPRRFIPGYQATVNGRHLKPLLSPSRQVMVPIPYGDSTVTLECTGPRYVVIAFEVSAWSWFVFLVWQLAGSRIPIEILSSIARWPACVLRFGGRHWICCGIGTCGVVGVILWIKCLEERRSYLAAVGPVSIDFMLPYGQKGFSQPLVSTGKAGAGAVVFVQLIDENHIAIGADVWGSLYKSQPIDVDFSRVQNIVISDSAFFPADHPAMRAINASEAAELRGEVKIELNGATVIEVQRFAYETTPSELMVGHTQFVSVSNPEFLGEILNTRRLLVPRKMTIPGGHHAHMVAMFPVDRSGTSEPLVTISRADSVIECYATYLTPTRLRVTSWSPQDGIVGSAELNYDTKLEHALDFTLGDADNTSLRLEVGCSFDGNHLFGASRVHTAGKPSVLLSAYSAAHAPGVEGRFTGSKMDLSLEPDIAATVSTTASGPVHMIVLFPSGKPGRHEPLLTTGKTGSGDLFYVVYADESHVQIGYDHWGVGGVLSKPVAVDYRAPHEIWIATDSLLSGPSDSRPSKTTVLFDGQKLIASPLRSYPSRASEITVGQNKIGGSTADPEFSGSIQFSERTGSASLPEPDL